MGIRRAIDMSIAALALICLSPLLLIIAAAVVIESPGNPLYRGHRIGRGGRRFRMWKFRTMVPDADKLGPSITGSQDPRITRVGRFLRKTKLDELPQFVNVLFGHMNLVGPRPEAPDIVALYTARQKAVLAVRPGITGPSQLRYSGEADGIPAHAAADQYYVNNILEEKLDRDLEYVRTRSAASDARIVLQTAGLVLRSILQR
jgi:lipopolysaccharide/colanic/teichoic acid biosynthesis glycosyltransferase